jgi:hypothetical protein
MFAHEKKNIFGLTKKYVKRMAFQLAVKNHSRHPFFAEEGKAGKKWLRHFLGRNPTLSLRKPQPIAAT